MNGTPRAIGPIADQVLAWSAQARAVQTSWHAAELIEPDALRRIELCALAAREAAMFHDLYGMETYATPPDLQGQRSAPGGLPQAEGEG